MALGLTQPLTEMSTRNLPGVKGQTASKAENLTAICEPKLSRKYRSLDVYGLSRPVTEIALRLFTYLITYLLTYLFIYLLCIY
jgi:hypothetical protein